jgi:NADH dehydrogenase/NADH:ubiquinone oxidoreductase subunit G
LLACEHGRRFNLVAKSLKGEDSAASPNNNTLESTSSFVRGKKNETERLGPQQPGQERKLEVGSEADARQTMGAELDSADKQNYGAEEQGEPMESVAALTEKHRSLEEKLATMMGVVEEMKNNLAVNAANAFRTGKLASKDGVAGDAGSDGMDGTAGVDGASGVDGTDGTAGAAGTAGKSLHRTWLSLRVC